ncbi:Tad domain-containing protein [uncultured Erythrobacter sp.]|uniref:Tad domain-containing protein n=1 Tax=uncultured Erythrobacter sp. TaxID=263913 RepID=UPI00260DAAA3|nr:Tad domain-containing protein [uncultured Erythrobacter sp.]
MGQDTQTHLPLFRRLAKDVTANTIAISAASLVPLMAMVGGGVDASRYYMTETRLQAACDAGALAARRAMDKNNFTGEHRNIGYNFFDQNYPDGTFGLEDRSRVYTEDDGTVSGVASGTLPTTIMGAFGYEEFNLTVECSAEINISNTDIMFVLDTTGSMAWNTDGTNCGVSGGLWVECADSRISALRDSVLTFYDTVDSATSASAQIRYGILPYSNQVNVGDSLNSSWMKTSHTYQSREADWQITYTYEPTDYQYTRTGSGYSYTSQGSTEENEYGLTYDQCVASINSRSDIYVSSSEATWTQTSQSGTDPRTTTYDGVVRYERLTFTGGYYYSSNGRCRLFYDREYYYADSTITVTEGRVENQEFFWAYRPVEWNVSSVYSNGSVSLPTGWEEANETHTWNGCIEEASTVVSSTWDPVPTGAYDLDIDLVPSSDDERWAPMLRSLAYYRYPDGSGTWTTSEVTGSTEDKSHPNDTCPKAARKLAAFDSRTDLENWVSASNGFIPNGATYHDFGMIWGGRFITPDGIFSSENATAPNGDAISRHIVFMTDGEQSTSNSIYGLYGIEWWDRRVTTDASSTNMATNHAERFQAACRAARNKNISVWVVAFGTTLSQNLIDCATPGRAYQASNSDELDTAFTEIAEKIAALRLTE